MRNSRRQQTHNGNSNNQHHYRRHQTQNNFSNNKDAMKLRSLREKLSRPDAIIDPKVIQALRQYPAISLRVNPGVNKQQSLKKYLAEGQGLLVNNYCGYTKLCNLLLDWMKNIQDAKTINNTFTRILKESAVELYQEQKMADNDGDNDDIDLENDIDSYKQEMIKTIDEITKTYGDTLIVHTGFSLFEFQDKFKNHLFKIFQSMNDMDYHRKLSRFISYCCKNELYYLYSRRLLTEIRENNLCTMIDYILSQIESKLDSYTNSIILNPGNNQNEKLNIQQNVNLSNCSRILELSVYAKGISFQSDLRVPATELLRKGSFTKADITKVYNYYQSHFKQNKCVKLRFLQNQQMIDYLYQTLFIPQQTANKITKTYMDQYSFLLNYALFEETNNNGNNGNNHNNKEEFNKHMKILRDVTEICRDTTYGVTLSENADKQNILFNGIKIPGIARGVLIWINYCMYIKSDKYFAENFETYLTPLLVSMIAQIATIHIFLRPSIAEFAYNMIYNIGDQTTSTMGTKSNASFSAKDTAASSIKNMEVIKTMLDIIVYIIQLGEYILVFDIINRRPNDLLKLDLSLHRHFITQIIKTCLDPLPNNFISNLYKLLKENQIIAAIRNDYKASKIVLNFVTNHQNVSSSDAQYILNNLQKTNEQKRY